MAKMTKEQLQKINNSCKNGWGLDIQYFMFHNEKTLIKHITIDDENYLQFKIDFDYENKIILRISKFHHKANDYFATSSGLGLMKINNETDVIRNIMFVPSEAF